MTTAYQEKAKIIVKDAIKSAIYIDEKAKEFYDFNPINETVIEEKLSVDLFTNFKEQGVSLAIHKFQQGNESDSDIKNYLFEDRDLVLLDWRLDGLTGEKYALKLLADIVNRPHIHFCAIYTSEINLTNIFLNILSYFSGKNAENYDEIKNILSSEEKELINLLPTLNNININRNNGGRDIGHLMGDNEKRELIQHAKTELGINDTLCALIHVGIAFNTAIKSDTANPCPTVIAFERKTLVINNTIITILKKEEDTDPENLITRLSEQVYQSENSFSLLLGLDMQNNFSNNSSFIDENLMRTSLDTLMYHRKQLTRENSDIEFQNFIKSVLFEQAKLTLESSSLKVLEPTFLDDITKNEYDISNNELAIINSFYNGSILKGKCRLNFGDVFIKEDDKTYYLCINALCDCLHPENINNNFFFVRGVKGNLNQGIKTGDSGFKSFINKETCVFWTTSEYIKPFQLHIDEPKIIEGNLKGSLLERNEKKDIALKYKFTLRPTYAQRIANHAFAHPLRVGVDFVKK